MESIDSDLLQQLNKEVSELKKEIRILRTLLVPEISLSKEELTELDRIQKEMEEGLEFPP